jgi:cellulose biosynthesis protein BcsQ
MGKIIAFYSYAKNSGKTTTAFNIANILANQNYKVIILELHYDSTYYKALNLKDSSFKTQNIFKHFTCHNLEANLTVVCLQEIINDNDE